LTNVARRENFRRLILRMGWRLRLILREIKITVIERLVSARAPSTNQSYPKIQISSISKPDLRFPLAKLERACQFNKEIAFFLIAREDSLQLSQVLTLSSSSHLMLKGSSQTTFQITPRSLTANRKSSTNRDSQLAHWLKTDQAIKEAKCLP
jgi:hypothetical protein